MGCPGGADKCFFCRRGREGRRSVLVTLGPKVVCAKGQPRAPCALRRDDERDSDEDLRGPGRPPGAARGSGTRHTKLLVPYRPLAAIAAGCPYIGP